MLHRLTTPNTQNLKVSSTTPPWSPESVSTSSTSPDYPLSSPGATATISTGSPDAFSPGMSSPHSSESSGKQMAPPANGEEKVDWWDGLVCAGLPKKLHSRLLEVLEVPWVGKKSRWSIILRVGTCAACKVVVGILGRTNWNRTTIFVGFERVGKGSWRVKYLPWWGIRYSDGDAASYSCSKMRRRTVRF